MNTKIKKALTIGELSRQLNCPTYRLDYLLRTRGIEPIERAGRSRIFSADVLETLRSELSRRCPADANTIFAGGTGGAQT